ncbi:MAG: GNAT family acetyltransferase [Gammaproteobacteria bacterium]|nr:GNAT family acetyltransferase [Gammaproteobacteria bacterium]MYD81636.1 GNAT family acetyltransferase [Gammaproteobacteria bacterium]
MRIQLNEGESRWLEIRSFEAADQADVVGLWHECDLVVPWNDPVKDIQRKLRVQGELFLVGLLNGRMVATVMSGYEGHRGWINYLAVTPEHRGQGIGRCMMDAAEVRLRDLGCPKINLQVRRSNTQAVDFYRSLGFIEDESISLGKRLLQD